MSTCCAGLLGRHNSLTSLEIIEGDVLSAMLRLITSTKHKNQLAGLQARLMIDFVADYSGDLIPAASSSCSCHNVGGHCSNNTASADHAKICRT